MIFAYFTLFVALVISAVAEFYSIVGLTAIFSAAFWPIVIMGASLGVGKVTAAVWLKLNWERASWTYKLYLVPAVAFLMVLTSMGIFGFLSKAHSDQSLVSGDSMAKVAIYDEKIKISKDNIDANRKALKQMDEAVDQVMGRSSDEKGADKAVAVRRSQQKERARLLAEIQAEQKTITALGEEAAPLRAEFRKVESEVGPIKYIAAMIYGDNPDANILEKAVRLVIMLIVAVFDPLALVLILAAQQSLKWARGEEETPVEVNKHTQTEETGHHSELAPVVEAEGEPRVPESTVDEQSAVAPAASILVEPIAQKEVDEPQTTVDPYAYLKRPYVHFKDLQPLAYKPDGIPLVKPLEGEEVFEDDGVDEEQFLEDFDANLAKGHETKSPILTLGIDEVERPGDYITPPEPEYDGPMKEVIEEHIDPNTRIKTFSHTWVPDLSAQPDASISGIPAHADFGNQFPTTPKKSDMYLRVDFLPAKLFKFNGTKWIEIDKSSTDSYAFNEEYIKYLIEMINSGQYNIEDLSDTEQEQIREYLSRDDN